MTGEHLPLLLGAFSQPDRTGQGGSRLSVASGFATSGETESECADACGSCPRGRRVVLSGVCFLTMPAARVAWPQRASGRGHRGACCPGLPGLRTGFSPRSAPAQRSGQPQSYPSRSLASRGSPYQLGPFEPELTCPWGPQDKAGKHRLLAETLEVVLLCHYLVSSSNHPEAFFRSVRCSFRISRLLR